MTPCNEKTQLYGQQNECSCLHQFFGCTGLFSCGIEYIIILYCIGFNWFSFYEKNMRFVLGVYLIIHLSFLFV